MTAAASNQWIGLAWSPALGIFASVGQSGTAGNQTMILQSPVTNTYGLTVNGQTGGVNNYTAQFVNGAVSVGTPNQEPSAVLSVASTTQGLLIPSMTTAQKNAIAGPAANLQVFDNTLMKQQSYQNSQVQSHTINGAGASVINTSAATWFSLAIGQFKEVAYTYNATTTGWTSNAAISTWAANLRLGITTNAANGSNLTYTLPETASVGMYMFIFHVYMDNSSAIVDIAFSQDNGNTYTNVRTGFDTGAGIGSAANDAVATNFFAVTTSGTVSIRFLANGKNALSGSFGIHIMSVQVFLVG
jgi:hypothetical protein